MYYRHDENYVLIEKSSAELAGDNIVTCDEDIDLDLFRVVIGFVNDNNVILRHTKFIKNAEDVSRRLTDIDLQQSNTVVDLDFRLSKLELGL